MLDIFKRISFKKTFTKKRIILLCILFIIVLTVFPFRYASAQLWNPKTWVSGAIALVLRIIIFVAKVFLRLGNWFLGVAISNIWQISYTMPGTAAPANPIIQIGWTLLRDITNMMFILGLAYIGLATALSISNFNVKKTFPKLLLIALLINFTPAICAVVVDIANIISSFFLQGIDFQVLLDVFSRQEAVIFNQWENLMFDGVKILKALFLIAYGFIAGFITLLYAFIFIARAPIIWILVILSPLAFFAWIFDQTKKYFDQWWGIFLQWAMIVIPSGFFLYLSQQVVIKSANPDFMRVPANGFMGSFISEIAPYLIALFFMIVGLIMAMKINVAGSGAIIKGAKFAGKKGSIKIVKKTKDLGEGIGAGVSGAVVGASEGKGVKGKLGGTLKGGFTKEGREKGRAKIEKGLETSRWTRHFVRPGFHEARKAKRWATDEKTQKRLERMGSEDIKKAMEKRPLTDREKKERAAMSAILAKRGDFAFRDAAGNIDHQKELKFLKEAKALGVDLQNLSKSRPDLTPILKTDKFKKQLEDEITRVQTANPALVITPQMRQNIETEQRKKMVTNEVRNMGARDFTQNVKEKAVLQNAAVVSGMDDAKRNNLARSGSQAQIDALKDARNRRGTGVATRTDMFNMIQEAIARNDRDEVRKLRIAHRRFMNDPNFS
ncbi:MAG: hypothetical protein HQ539_02315 [Parcubacteria group bacterium]|nr:hypothetical protein [Parcubacteria group bacterium]